MDRSGWDPGLSRRLGRRLFVFLAGANCIGAAEVFFYGTYLLPKPHVARADDLQQVSLVLFGVYMVVTGIVGTMVGNRITAGTWAWLREGRPPTVAEKRNALALPWRIVVLTFGLWAGASLVFTPLQIIYGKSALETVGVVDSIVLGGLCTSMLTFLVVERALRPVFALALVGDVPQRPRTLGVRPRIVLSWALGSAVPLLSIGLSFIGTTAEQRAGLGTAVVFLVAIGLGTGCLIMLVAAKSVAEPLDEVRAGLQRVRAGDIDVELPVDDGGEVGLVQAGFNEMVKGLRERRRLHELFDRHVGNEVARQALERGVGLGGEQRDVSALFVDLIASTALAQERPAEEVVATLNAMFDAVVRVVDAEGGWVNKFEGDGALCVFGAPVDQPDHARRALRAARQLRRELLRLSATHPGLDAAIGVSSGLAVAGNVGAEQRYEYTVIGDSVNEAARLSERAKDDPLRVLASEASVARAADESGEWEVVGPIDLRGRAGATLAYAPRAATVADQGAEATALQARSTPSSSTS